MPGRKTGGRRYREKLARLHPTGSFENWNVRAGVGIAAAATAASSYKSAEIPRDAAQRIYSTWRQHGLLKESERSERKLRVLDAAAGEGGFGEAVRQELHKLGVPADRLEVHAVDVTPKLLAQNPAEWKRLADIAALKLGNSRYYDAVLIRYGMEGMQKEEQLRFIRRAFSALKPGGVYYAVNMVAPEGTKNFMRAYKLAKRAPYEQTGAYSPHIPTHAEHLAMISGAGLKGVEKVTPSETKEPFYRSNVTTTKWRESNQFGEVHKKPETEEQQRMNETAERRRLEVAQKLYSIANPAAQSGIRMKFTDMEGKEVPLEMEQKHLHLPRVHEVQMSWPVGAYTGHRPLRERG